MGHGFGRDVQKETVCTILPINSNTNKHSRIIMEGGFIRKYFYFLKKRRTFKRISGSNGKSL